MFSWLGSSILNAVYLYLSDSITMSFYLFYLSIYLLLLLAFVSNASLCIFVFTIFWHQPLKKSQHKINTLFIQYLYRDQIMISNSFNS